MADETRERPTAGSEPPTADVEADASATTAIPGAATADPAGASGTGASAVGSRGADASAKGAAATETRVQRPVTPARARAEAAADSGRTAFIRVADRAEGDGSRTSPRMRFDLLQIAAWLLGLALIVAGLVALARAGFDELALFEPVVEVGGQLATPLYALLWLLLGAVLLAAATGSVAEQRLRVLGVVLAVVGLVFLIEPDAFTEYLGVDESSGSALLVAGVVLVATSFVPPLSIRRPGIREDAARR